jgi:hypothetical protein
MRIAILNTCAVIAFVAVGTAAEARGFDYSNPYDDDVRSGLHFADLEFSMPTDPYTWSSDPGWEPHHTPARFLAEARDAIGSAVPNGTPATDAALVLHKAGARCASASVQELDCHYRDVETPYGGQYWDNVVWEIKLPLVDGRVAGVTVTRDWMRR